MVPFIAILWGVWYDRLNYDKLTNILKHNVVAFSYSIASTEYSLEDLDLDGGGRYSSRNVRVGSATA